MHAILLELKGKQLHFVTRHFLYHIIMDAVWFIES